MEYGPTLQLRSDSDDVTYNPITDQVGEVKAIIHNPTLEQIEAHGINLTGDIPQPLEIQGFYPALRIDLVQEKLYFDYITHE